MHKSKPSHKRVTQTQCVTKHYTVNPKMPRVLFIKLSRHSLCRVRTKILLSISCLFFALDTIFMKQNDAQRFHIQLHSFLKYSSEFKMKKIYEKCSLGSLKFYFGHSRLHSRSCKHLMHVLNFVQPFDPCNHKSLFSCVNIWRTRHVRVAVCVYSEK